MDTSPFEQITSSLTVKSICSPFGPDVRAGSNSFDTLEDLMPEYGNTFTSRVIDSNGNVVGFIDWSDDPTHVDVDEDTVVDEVMERVESNKFLTSATTILSWHSPL
jgi:hypothetical protein